MSLHWDIQSRDTRRRRLNSQQKLVSDFEGELNYSDEVERDFVADEVKGRRDYTEDYWRKTAL